MSFIFDTCDSPPKAHEAAQRGTESNAEKRFREIMSDSNEITTKQHQTNG
jgi:hypothetical protein